MYTFQEIVKLSETKTGREIAVMLGARQPSDSFIPEETYLKNEGGRIIRAARDQVAEGNGSGLYGERKRRNGNGAGKKVIDPLATIQDIEIVMAARLAAKKAGIDETGEGIREAIESGNTKVIAFLDFTLSQEQRAILEKAVGVLSPAEREAKRRADLIAAIRMAVLKAARLDSMRKELESSGFLVEAPAWFADVSGIDLATIDSNSTSELAAMAEKIA